MGCAFWRAFWSALAVARGFRTVRLAVWARLARKATSGGKQRPERTGSVQGRSMDRACSAHAEFHAY
eukprot:15467584-Alexandrium_andersonii.AAC.1